MSQLKYNDKTGEFEQSNDTGRSTSKASSNDGASHGSTRTNHNKWTSSEKMLFFFILFAICFVFALIVIELNAGSAFVISLVVTGLITFFAVKDIF